MENVTVYDDLPTKMNQETIAMELDHVDKPESLNLPDEHVPSSNMTSTQNTNHDSAAKETPVGKPDAKNHDDQTSVPDMDMLYPIFWNLQNFFSTPTKLFDASNLTAFKNGLELTLRKFKQTDKDLESSGSSRNPEENKRGTKRKRGGSGDDLAASFNPKYLTSRDLFELEVLGHLTF